MHGDGQAVGGACRVRESVLIGRLRFFVSRPQATFRAWNGFPHLARLRLSMGYPVKKALLWVVGCGWCGVMLAGLATWVPKYYVSGMDGTWLVGACEWGLVGALVGFACGLVLSRISQDFR